MKIKNNRLFHNDGTAFPLVKTTKQKPSLEAKYLVLHYTAGSTAEGAIHTLTHPEASRASAHIVVDVDGSITQLVDFDRVAFHAGRSKWRGLNELNLHSIGIEIVNPGWLELEDGEWYTWFDTVVPTHKVLKAKHKNTRWQYAGWHVFTNEQVAAVRKLASLLVGFYNLTDIVGHDDIAPTRKQDPGPAFPLEQLRLDVMGSFLFETSDDAGEGLNIRAGAGVAHATVAQPLPRGTKVKILDADGYWWRVRVQSGAQEGVEGWVHGNYLQHAVQAADPQPA